MLDGTRNRRYTQLGMPIRIADRQQVPTSINKAPETRGHLSRLLHEIRNPVETPAIVADMEDTISLNPLSVALSRRTAWKYRGMLKSTALTMMAARKLQNMMFARGLWVIILRGMIGRSTRVSHKINSGKPMENMTRDYRMLKDIATWKLETWGKLTDTTMGCDHS